MFSSIKMLFHWTKFSDGMRNQDAKAATWMPEQEVVQSLSCQIVTRFRLEMISKKESGEGGTDLRFCAPWPIASVYSTLISALPLLHVLTKTNLKARKEIKCTYTQWTDHDQTLGTILESSFRC